MMTRRTCVDWMWLLLYRRCACNLSGARTLYVCINPVVCCSQCPHVSIFDVSIDLYMFPWPALLACIVRIKHALLVPTSISCQVYKRALMHEM